MKQSTKVVLIIVVAALLPALVMLQSTIDPQRKQFLPERQVVSSVVTQVGNSPVVLPSQFVAGAIIGFREVVAGLLWVRANDFFHTGNYEAIIPLARIVTWLDPHQIDVYSVGAWHLAYNLVDAQSRGDRRYLLPAIKFLEEGIQNNPNLFDLYFEQGFTMYYWKKCDYTKAVYWLNEASKQKCPYYVHTQVSHAYERDGRIDAAIAQWRKCIRLLNAELKKNPTNKDAWVMREVSRRNLDLTIIRKMDRAERARNPLDARFDASFERLGPRKFRISGNANLPDGARVEMSLADADYEEPTPRNFNWVVDPKLTLLYDSGVNGIQVADGHFERDYDLTRDIKQHPLAKDRYTLTIWFNPRNATQDIKDWVGWSGEGMTDKRYLDTSTKGLRLLKKVIVLKREDII